METKKRSTVIKATPRPTLPRSWGYSKNAAPAKVNCAAQLNVTTDGPLTVKLTDCPGGTSRTEGFSLTFSCARPSGRLAGRSLGPVTLGMTRARARSRFSSFSQRGRRYMDFFCPAHGGIRVGYASPTLLRTLSRSEQRSLRGRSASQNPD